MNNTYRGVVKTREAQRDLSGFEQLPAVAAALEIVSVVRGAGVSPFEAPLQGLRDGDTDRQILKIGFGQSSRSDAVGSLFLIETHRDSDHTIYIAVAESPEMERFALDSAEVLSGNDPEPLQSALAAWLREEFARDPKASMDNLERVLGELGFA